MTAHNKREGREDCNLRGKPFFASIDGHSSVVRMKKNAVASIKTLLKLFAVEKNIGGKENNVSDGK